MNISELIDLNNLHHAYLLEGEANWFLEIQKHVRDKQTTEEVYIREFDTFGIDDSRELIQLAQMRSLGRQLFFYKVTSFTPEAQNALLKLFEEPPPHTHFFFCVPNIEEVLVTLRSRMIEVTRLVISDKDATKIGRQFIGANFVQRMEQVAIIVEDKDKIAAIILLQSIEENLYEHKKQKTVRDALTHIFSVRRILNKRGTSLKIVLESVALVVPFVSL